jgi:hypothetical protein
MGQIYRIVAPPDPAIARRKWIVVISLATLALIVAAIIFGPGLYHAARLATEGPGKGPVLVKRADGKIELQVPPAEVLIGKPYKWRKLGSMQNYSDGLFYVGDFDGEGNQELLWWPAKAVAVLYKPDGSVTKPGLLQSDGFPWAFVLDWNGDGIDELCVSMHDLPVETTPPHRKPGLYDKPVCAILTIHNVILGNAKYIYSFTSFGSFMKGSFSDPTAKQIAQSALFYSANLEPGDYSYNQLDSINADLASHPKYFIINPKDQADGTIKGIAFWSHDFLSTDLDGDRIDEILSLNSDGKLWKCKYESDPQVLAGWPNLTAPVVAGNLDSQAGDEIVSVRPDPKLRGNILASSIVMDQNNTGSINENDPLVKYTKQMDDVVKDLAKQRLHDAGVDQPVWLYDKDGRKSQDSRLESGKQLIQYYDQFSLPENISVADLDTIVSWDYYRPIGLIYDPKTHSCNPLQFPRCLRWSNAWEMNTGFHNIAVICRHPGAQTGIIYVIPTVGTGVLGFNHQGKCIYYEEFGKGVSCCGVLHTKDGDYLVLLVGNDLMIYP